MRDDPNGQVHSLSRLHHPYQEGVDTRRSLYAPTVFSPSEILHTL